MLISAHENRRVESYAPLVAPRAVASFADGSYVLADAGTGIVHLFDPDGWHDNVLDAAGTDLIPLDLVAHGFHLFVLDGVTRWVLRYTEEGIFRDRAFDPQRLDPTLDPVAMDVDTDGRFAIADAANHQIVVTDPFFGLDTRLGSYGAFEGQLADPAGVAFGWDGLLYVSEAGNRRIQAFDRTGLAVGTTLSMGGVNDLLVAPAGLDTDRHGNVYVADPGRGAVVVLGSDLGFRFTLGEDDLATDALDSPVDVWIGPGDRLFVVDAGRRSLVVFQLVYP